VTFRGAVVPVVTAYALTMWIVLYARRHPVTRPRPRVPLTAIVARRLVRELAPVVVGGYLAFLAVVFLFGAVLLGDASLFPSAAGGGAVLVAIAVPVFAAASWVESRITARR